MIKLKIKNNYNKHFFITKYNSIICIEDIISIVRYTLDTKGNKKYVARLKGSDEVFNLDSDDQEKLIMKIKELGYD